MAERVSFNNMRNLPVKTSYAYEGTLTRTTGVSPEGGTQPNAVYSAPIAKGDPVRVYVSATSNDQIVVEKATAGDNLDYVYGIAVSDPQGIDNTTVSGATPIAALRRKIDIAFFGIGIVEFESSATIPPGSALELSESETGVVGDAGTDAQNGGWTNLNYGTDGQILAVLVGFSGLQPAD